jgi:single-stranded-DNA-specific exonuclease
MDLPAPIITPRKVDKSKYKQALDSGLEPILARILAARPWQEGINCQDLVSPRLKQLDNPSTLKDIDIAVNRIVDAIIKGEVIGIETDHDCDGQTSHAVILTALVEYFNHPKDKIASFIGHRLEEGYGLSDSLCKRILASNPRPSLIITADNGSSDEERIKVLQENSIDVIVTDHHELPVEGPPKSALAVINPTRDDCDYPDPLIAGCMVAWLVMARTRQILLDKKLIDDNTPNLAGLLDFVAVGTVADCVSIARSQNNRAIVFFGMRLIEKCLRPCWRAIQQIADFPLTSEDLGFKVGPLLNSDGRLASAFGSVSFLLSETDGEAIKWINHLKNQNQQRKDIQKKITETAMFQALEQYHNGRLSLCINMSDGHSGVHGISASRIKEAFGRPTIILCQKQSEPDLLTGSARSIDGLHLREVLQAIDDKNPNILEKFGGHSGAAGLSLRKENIDKFSTALEEEVIKVLDKSQVGPRLFTDGELDESYFDIDGIGQLWDKLEPFGREFEPPLFEITAQIVSLKGVGKPEDHLKLVLQKGHLVFSAIWFFCLKWHPHARNFKVGDTIKLAYVPRIQQFRNQWQLSCTVEYASQIP